MDLRLQSLPEINFGHGPSDVSSTPTHQAKSQAQLIQQKKSNVESHQLCGSRPAQHSDPSTLHPNKTTAGNELKGKQYLLRSPSLARDVCSTMLCDG